MLLSGCLGNYNQGVTDPGGGRRIDSLILYGSLQKGRLASFSSLDRKPECTRVTIASFVTL